MKTLSDAIVGAVKLYRANGTAKHNKIDAELAHSNKKVETAAKKMIETTTAILEKNKIPQLTS